MAHFLFLESYQIEKKYFTIEQHFKSFRLAFSSNDSFVHYRMSLSDGLSLYFSTVGFPADISSLQKSNFRKIGQQEQWMVLFW